MDLICYLHPGWAPLIRPAPATRAWMDASPESFARRCLPLNIANAHGWEVLSPCGFDARWNGATGAEGVDIRCADGAAAEHAPVSLFGQGVLTFHIQGIFRTPPGWNLWIGGSPNRQKDAIQPLSGIIETDWSPFTFTMNWRFTRPDAWVRFEAGEPIGFFFPVKRGLIETFEPVFRALGEDPDLMRRFQAWSRSRDAFHLEMQARPPVAPADKWQKHYYRGVDAAGTAIAADHQTKVRVKPFDRGGMEGLPAPPADDPPERALTPPDADSSATLALRKREWLLETIERQRQLTPLGAVIERRANLSGDEFLERYYVANRPVILTGEMAGWPALALWTPDYLAKTVGAQEIEYQGGRAANPRFEEDKERHRRRAPFDAFIAMIEGDGAGNDAYMTAYNWAGNAKALAALDADLGHLDRFLDRSSAGMMWIGPAGTLTSLHHDLTNNLIAQVRGRKRLKIVPAAQAGRLYNHRHTFSEIADLDAVAHDGARYDRLNGAHVYELELAPGEIVFMPVGWWHQVTALDFSVTVTYTNFLWPNDAHLTYPAA
ncbi:MAG TPA: DUF6065 family protein [Caulobacteraceae bacterium]|nr:DUF6065 family protein [Caulobacteraceae bacterium]